MSDVYERETINHRGRLIRVERCYDTISGPPWQERDGHGIVSGWVTRDKRPGELILSNDGKAHRYYDWEGTMARARKEGWGCGIDDFMRLTCKLRRCPTRKQVIEDAVRRDFNYLHGWCNDEWHWMGILVEDEETGVTCSMYSICSTDEAYIKEVTDDLCEEIYVPTVIALMGGNPSNAAA